MLAIVFAAAEKFELVVLVGENFLRFLTHDDVLDVIVGEVLFAGEYDLEYVA